MVVVGLVGATVGVVLVEWEEFSTRAVLKIT